MTYLNLRLKICFGCGLQMFHRLGMHFDTPVVTLSIYIYSLPLNFALRLPALGNR
jgi:hypothetical protein